MLRKSLTILSLIGLLVSVGLLVRAEYKIRRLNARFQEAEIQVVTISGIDQETGEALRVTVGRPTPPPAGFTYSASDPIEGVTLKWFDPRRFEINVWVDDYETQRIELDYLSPHEIEVALRPVQRGLPLAAQERMASQVEVFTAAGFLAKRRHVESLRRKLGLCIKCRYDLKGLTEPRCPECSTQFESHD